MNWTDFQNFYKIIENDQMSLFYRGDFADEVTVKLIDISDLYFGTDSDRVNMRKKVAFLIAECFQNVIRHGDVSNVEERLPEHAGYFMTRNVSGDYCIASGNLVDNKYVDSLKSKIENINRLGQEELKIMYMNVLGKGGISSKGGAGLGLIEMARKSGRKLEAEFKKINDRHAFFYLQILIESANNNTPKPYSDICSICKSVEINELLKKNDVLMAYQGDFRQEAILPLLNMIDKNLDIRIKHSHANKTLFHIMVEMLQNIMHHGYASHDKKEGVFTVAISDQKFNVSTANYVENKKAGYLNMLLEHFLSLSQDELKDEYKKILRNGPDNPDGGAGLGLIDIIRASNEPIQYKLINNDDLKTLFYLNVIL